MAQSGILPPELASINQLFSGDTLFTVPKYQRSFAWGRDEIEELWDDINSAMKRDRVYFLGTLVLQQKEKNVTEIIDGQQRLSCLNMILSAIRNVFVAVGDKREDQLFLDYLVARGYSKNKQPIPKFVMNRVNNDFYVRYIIGSKDQTDVEKAIKSKGINQSNKLLLEAYSFFLEKISTETAKLKENSDDFIVPLIECIGSSIKFITIPVTTEEDANLFFESLNARGKELAVSDLVKNRLYLELSHNINRAQELWENIENELAGKSIPEYLRHYWIAKRADTKNLNIREKGLYKSIAQEVDNKPSKTMKLLEDLSKSSNDYVMINDYNLWPDENAYDAEFEASLKDLQLFRVTQCHPLLLNAIQTFSSSKDIVRTFRIVVNFSFRYFIIGNQSPGNLERESARIAYGIRTGKITDSNGIADAFRAINPDAAFRSDFALAKIQKTRAKIARFLLTKISNHLAGQSRKGGIELIVNPDAKDVNLEHILPQHFGKNWLSSFSEDEDPSDYIDRIGNLTLLTKKINSELANASFIAKKEAFENSSKLEINKYFSKIDNWGNLEIEYRQEHLAKIALDIWKI